MDAQPTGRAGGLRIHAPPTLQEQTLLPILSAFLANSSCQAFFRASASADDIREPIALSN